MPLYRIEQGKVKNVPPKDFASEAELQKLIDENLEDITGVRLVDTEYSIPNGRMDSIGIDEQNVPVVIEYKWGHDPRAIIQGLFYLQWVKHNRKTFELLVKDRFGNIKVNWSSPPRLLIIAKQFDIKELSAIDMMVPSVELLRYSFYGDMLSLDDVTPTKTMKDDKSEKVPISEEEKTVEDILKKASPDLRRLFLRLRDEVLNLGDDVREKVGASYTDYRKTSTFATIFPQTNKNRLMVYIKMGDNPLDDTDRWVSDIPETYRLGRLNKQFYVQSADQLNYAMRLISQAYGYVP